MTKSTIKGWQKASLAVLAVLGVVGIIGGLVTYATTGSIAPGEDPGDQDPEPGEIGDEDGMVSVSEYAVDAHFSYDHVDEENLEQYTVTLLEEQPDEWENWGVFTTDVQEHGLDNVDVDDYTQETADEDGDVVFEDLEPGDYHVFVGTGFDEQFYQFGTFEMPEQVDEFRVIQDTPIRIHNDMEPNPDWSYSPVATPEVASTGIFRDGAQIDFQDGAGHVELDADTEEDTQSFTLELRAGDFEGYVNEEHDEGYTPLGPMQVDLVEDALDDEVLTEAEATLVVDGDETESVTLVEDSEEVYDEHDYEVVAEDSTVEFSSLDDPTVVSDEEEVHMIYELEVDESEIEDRTTAYDLLDANVDTAYAVGDSLFEVAVDVAPE